MQCSCGNCKTVVCACYSETLALSVQGKIKSLEQIYLFSMPVKEYQIVENFLGSALKDEVMKIMPVQKQTRAGQRTRFKAFVVVGDHAGHVGLGVKCAKEVSQSGCAGNCIWPFIIHHLRATSPKGMHSMCLSAVIYCGSVIAAATTAKRTGR